MADLFISYKSDDRARVAPLVAALGEAGFSVWWDAQIAGGAAWSEAIEAELEAARCVLVVWSHGSVGSEGRFVRDEARRALRRHAYLPVRIDSVEPPLGFGEVQVLSLEGWRGTLDDPRLAAVIQAARRMVDGGSALSAPLRIAPTARRGVLWGAGAAALGLAGAWHWWPKPAPATRIAVLPLEDLSGDPTQAWFASGLTEELRSALAQVPGLTVFGGISSAAVRDLDPREAAAKLGVGSILAGSVRRSAGALRVTARLIDGSDGAEQWSATYDRTPGDAIAIQSAIAQNVASVLQLRLTDEARQAAMLGGTHDTAAFDLVLQARSLLDASSGAVEARHALGLIDRALALDPAYGKGWALRARPFFNLYYVAPTPEEFLGYCKMAESSARHALAVSPGLAAGQAALGLALGYQLHLREARAAMVTAAHGNDPDAMINILEFLAPFGPSSTAERLLGQAELIDPLNFNLLWQRARLLQSMRRFAEALALGRQMIARQPDRVQSYRTTGELLLDLNRPSEALAVLSACPVPNLVIQSDSVIARLAMGETAAADAAYRALRVAGGNLLHYQYAQIEAMAGRPDAAFAELDLAWKFSDAGLWNMGADHFLDPLRGDKRFKAQMERFNRV